jgi:hypothetical protein
VQAAAALAGVEINVEPELSGDDNLSLEGGKRFPHQRLIVQRAVSLGGVKASYGAAKLTLYETGSLTFIIALS